MTLVAAAFVLWAAGWMLNVRLATGPVSQTRAAQLAVPIIFGLTLLGIWELVVRGLDLAPEANRALAACSQRYNERMAKLREQGW